jgi:hypothetical protein
MARITIGHVALLFLLIAAGCSKREAPQYDLSNCTAHLSEMDAQTRAECLQIKGIPLKQRAANDPPTLFGSPIQPKQTTTTANPEDLRLDARGLK